MVGNTLKIISTLIIGYFIGLIFGMILGFFIGAVPGLFIKEIIQADQTILASIAMSLFLGGLLGFSGVKFVNKIFQTSIMPFSGIWYGLAIGFIVVTFMVGVIDISDIDTFDQIMYMLPIIYGGKIGSKIGSILFAIMGAKIVYRDISANKNEQSDNRERLKKLKMFLGMDSTNDGKRG